MTRRVVARRARAWMSLLLGLGVLLAAQAEVEARGRGRGGGISRGGPARGGSIRHGGMGRGHRSYEPSRRGGAGRGDWGTPRRDSGWGSGDWREPSREGGAGGRLPGTDERPARRPEGAARGEAGERRPGARGEDGDRRVKIKKTDDGFIAVGAVKNDDGGAVGVVRRKDGQTRIRAAKRDGDQVSWGGVNCRGGQCTGGRTTVKIEDYDYYPYYYYPYYYGYYSCPSGATRWYGDYGNPVYGCANVVVISTTISLGVAESSSGSSMTAGHPWPREADVSSAPVVMYASSDDVVTYATPYEPSGGVYAEKVGDRWLWAPGPAESSAEAKQAIEQAAASETPTANATVITYEVDGRVVYLTNERPLPGYYSVEADRLFVWMPGVREPGPAERDLMDDVVEAHLGGGQAALDREVRDLEVNRVPPPDATG